MDRLYLHGALFKKCSGLRGPKVFGRENWAGGMVMTGPRFVKSVAMNFEGPGGAWMTPAGGSGGHRQWGSCGCTGLECSIKEVVRELATIIQDAMVICM
jgi:hypothetical protein